MRRTPDPDDRRNRIVGLTDSGRALLGACRASIRVLEGELLADLERGERAALISMLERLVGRWDDDAAPGGP